MVIRCRKSRIVNRTFRSFLFPYSWLITSILTSVTRRVRLGEQELFQSTCVHSPSFSLVYAPQSLIIWVVVCGQLLIFNSFYFDQQLNTATKSRHRRKLCDTQHNWCLMQWIFFELLTLLMSPVVWNR
jgi:hypothetical protein